MGLGASYFLISARAAVCAAFIAVDRSILELGEELFNIVFGDMEFFAFFEDELFGDLSDDALNGALQGTDPGVVPQRSDYFGPDRLLDDNTVRRQARGLNFRRKDIVLGDFGFFFIGV